MKISNANRALQNGTDLSKFRHIANRTLLIMTMGLLPVVLMQCNRESSEIRQQDLAYYVYTLSSDAFQGRESGSADSRRAAAFFASRYVRAGLFPAFGDSFLMDFTFEAGIKQGAGNRLIWLESVGTSTEPQSPPDSESDTRDAEPETGKNPPQSEDEPDSTETRSSDNPEGRIIADQVVPLPLARPRAVTAEVVYLGFCIEAPEQGHNDYAGVDVSGKIIACLRHGPGGDHNAKFRQKISFFHKYKTATQHNVAGVLFIGRPEYPAPSVRDFRASFQDGPPALFVQPEQLADRFPDIKTEYARLLAGDRFRRHGETLGRATIQTDFSVQQHLGRNAGAYLRSPKPDQEIIIVGAHLDHLGMGTFSSMEGEGAIHNGADDNASGSAVVLELALALSAIERGESISNLKRLPENVNVLFLNFDAEERGLIGAARFADSDFFPDSKRVRLMINLDMVGRLRPDKGLTIQGYQTADERLEKLFRESYAAASFPEDTQLNLMKGGAGPSDHSIFYQRNIPVAFMYTGAHKQYHTSEDDYNTINLAGLYHIARMTANLIEQVAMLEQPLQFRRAPAEPDRSAFEFDVRLGIIPGSYEQGGDGLPVGGVREEAPVAATGLREGDVIIQLGDQKIGDINDLMNFLSDATVRKEYRIVFRRGSEIIEARTKLMSGD
ncbi:MAG: M28 family peptidase [Leptospiraceae bacterium]|nr:M28 family peptidase [Leptospiraceae bacterium]